MLCFYTSAGNVHTQFVLAFKLLLLCVFWKEINYRMFDTRQLKAQLLVVVKKSMHEMTIQLPTSVQLGACLP